VDERGSFGYYAIGEGVVAVEVIEYICPGLRAPRLPQSETSAIRSAPDHIRALIFRFHRPSGIHFPVF
jgi:hypothetical protein